MGNETQINSVPSSSSSSPSTSSNVSTASSLPYAASRESKKSRKPISIFDLPCPPKCAPPQDDKSFFDRMDSIEKALEEEDAGKIPKTLEAGPEIVVESLNKKRRRIQITETPLVVAPHPHPASSPSLSSSSSAQLLDSFSSVSSDTLPASEKAPESNEVTAPQPPAKKVRFREEIEYHFIESRPSPSIRRSSRLASVRRRSSRSDHAIENATELSPPMSSRILTPEMLYPEDDEKKFQDWLSGSTPPPPLSPFISQQMTTDTSGGQTPIMREKTQETELLADSQISNDLDSGQDESEDERQTHSPSPNYERDSWDWEESLPASELDISARNQGSQVRIGESDGEDRSEDQGENRSKGNNDGNVEISIDSDNESKNDNASRGYIGENSEINVRSSNTQLLERSCKSNTHATHASSESLIVLPGSLEIASVESSKESEGPADGFGGGNDGGSSGNNKDIFEITPISDPASSAKPSAKSNTKHNTKPPHTTAHTTLVEPLANANSSTGPIDISEMASASSSKALGRSKKGKDTTTSIAAIIGSRRKQNIVQKPPITGESQILTSSTETGNSTNTTQFPRGTIPVINLDEEDYAIGSNLETAKMVHLDQTIVPVGSTESSPTTKQMPMNNKERVETAKSEPPKSTPGPLSKLGLYVIPTNMDSRIFDITRKRVIDLGGSWLGPRVKTLATDPRAKPDVPDLDPEKTTHIVTALTSIEDVKRFLSVDEINLKISVVNREWLSDTIMYKTPMEPQSYALRKVQPIAPLTQVEDITPPPTQGRANREAPQEMPENQWFPKFKSMVTGNQIAFNDIVQGIQEGSLDDPDILDTDDDGIVDGDIEEPGKNIEIHAPEEGLNPNEAANPNRLSDDNQPELTPKMKRELVHENRCFRCKEVGHWANRCPQPKPKPKDDEVLLQIINSGKSEGKRRKILYQCQSPHVVGKKEEPKYNKAILEQ
ncbi:hypothetical protein BGZ79_006388, partial [Entomortierella chlamydospora]